ncbi:glutamine amidotransferase [Ectothiorhodospira mobilis]|uniref:glutamine amidotransferase n=1 Tax=Ectothiorhodospira mobilis TaxID=195064 RepID=UPI001EE7D96D|nr:glutamine amidotransferase [Ectothiorhodospira mobilis]MCG5534823.1 glutamine amidotransferase [Ectothiorhodospira mobilis]
MATGQRSYGMLLVIKTGTKLDTLADVPGDYEDWISAGMGWPREAVQVAHVPRGDPLPAPDSVTAAVVTGSGAMVTAAAPWMARSGRWLVAAVEQGLPVLGICFGHQLLAWALGGKVGDNPNGIEVGTVEVSLEAAAAEDPLFSALPKRFPAQVSHTQSVLALPPGAVSLGHSAMEAHQGFCLGPKAWGLQFHPEFDRRIIPRYVDSYRPRLEAAGRPLAPLLEGLRESPESTRVLARFAALASGTPDPEGLRSGPGPGGPPPGA